MNTLVRWNPMAELRALDRAMDELIGSTAAAALPMDLYETDAAYEVRLAAPGLTADAFEVTLHKGVLTVKAAVQSATPEGARAHVRELRSGSFSRAVRFPADVNADAVEATLEHGVLSIRVPKAETAQPRKISISAS
jgi:HSP20 family protein